MTQLELANWIKLALTPGLGPASFLRLIQVFGSASAVLRADRKAVLSIVNAEIFQKIVSNTVDPLVEAALTWSEQDNCSLMTLQDNDYPEQLANISRPPPLLFIRGNRQLLKRSMLAIVGSRRASAVYKQLTEKFAEELAANGYTIVSGLACGIDTAAHQGALYEVASTIAVVGTGVDRVYPASNKKLAEQIVDKGAILSEFPLGMRPLAGNFPRRNRIIAGLSQGCLVVEADLKSGSLITARIAMESGREVFAVPGSVLNPLSQGCHRLIKDGARLVESSRDILDDLIFAEPGLSMVNTQEKLLLNKDNHILNAMNFDPIDIDSLAQNLQILLPELSAQLLQLELSGWVVSLPGNRYQRLK